jgi:nucleotide-binding universal stress UspA family protein
MSAAPTLVFGDDRSASGALAWSWIDSHAWPDWRLEVVHATDAPLGSATDHDAVTLHPWQPPEPRVPSASAGFTEVVHLTAAVDPRVALLRDDADLLVIGPRGRGLLKALHLGSVAEWLLTRPPSPMVIAKTGTPVRNVLLAHDGSDSADRTLQALCALPWISTTTCTLVVVDDGRVRVDRTIEKATAALTAAGITPELVRAQGAPTGVISGEIDRRKPDLVALGTRGLTGLRRFHLGSTASAIARSAQSSLLVACAGDHADGPTA